MAKKRSPRNVQSVIDGEVLVSWAEDPKFSFEGVPDDTWETLGILTDGSKIELNRTIERNKISGAGFGVVDVAVKPGELTASAETLEDNDVVQRIEFPSRQVKEGKVVDGEASVLFHDEEVSQPYVALVTKTKIGTLIRVSRYPVMAATIEDLGYNLGDAQGRAVNFDFETGPNKDAFDEIYLERSNEEVRENVDIIRFSDDANTAGTTDEANTAGATDEVETA